MSKTSKVNTTGTIATSISIVGVFVKPGASDGVVELRQDDGSGDKSIDLEFNANGPSVFVAIPGGGVEYGGVCHAVLTNIDSVTIIYKDI